jgi:hypothetical protein
MDISLAADRQKLPNLRARAGMTILESMVGLALMSIVLWYGIQAYESLKAQSANQLLQAAADRENALLLRDLAKTFRFRVVKVASTDAYKFSFKLTAIAPLTASPGPCYGLSIREAHADGPSVLVARTAYRNACASGLGKPAGYYDTFSSIAKCPASSPRPVIVRERWADESDMTGAADTIYQPASFPPTATTLAGSHQNTLASQICFVPLKTGAIYRSIRAVAVTGYVGINGALTKRQADLELPLLEIISADDDGATITVRENGKMEIIR